MKKIDKLLEIVENGMLSVNLQTHIDVCNLQTIATDYRMIKARLADELIAIIKPQIESFVEDNFFCNGKPDVEKSKEELSD